jgi:pyrroline-5-carboxylate reductase
MKLGFIGTGNMASAIMGGIIKKQIIAAEEIIGAIRKEPEEQKTNLCFGQ